MFMFINTFVNMFVGMFINMFVNIMGLYESVLCNSTSESDYNSKNFLITSLFIST